MEAIQGRDADSAHNAVAGQAPAHAEFVFTWVGRVGHRWAEFATAGERNLAAVGRDLPVGAGDWPWGDLTERIRGLAVGVFNFPRLGWGGMKLFLGKVWHL